jgi:hypothetical protein
MEFNSKAGSEAFSWNSFPFAFLLMLLFFSSQLHAQLWVNGRLKDQFSKQPIANGEISSTLSKAVTDSNGSFRIQVREGEIISAKKSGYRFDTIHFSFHSIDSVLMIYMEPLGNMLKPVTVSTSYSAYQVDSMRRRMAFDEARSKTTLISTQPHPGFGLVFNLDRHTKSNDRQVKKQRELFEKTEQLAYVQYRFPDSMVQYYTGLTADRLHIFMKQYTPSYEWLRAHPSKVEIVYYINDCMKEFRKKKPL